MIKAVEMAAVHAEAQSRIDPLLLEVADMVNTTLDLDTTLRRIHVPGADRLANGP